MSTKTRVVTNCDGCPAVDSNSEGGYHPINWVFIRTNTFTRTDEKYGNTRGDSQSNYCPDCIQKYGIKALIGRAGEFHRYE